MKPVSFIFTVHCHQPVGRSDEKIKEAYLKAYLPFIETFEKYPNIKLAANYSGTLYEWFAENHPEFLEKLKLMARRGQLELLSGGYYEPIIPLTPYGDAIEQIKMGTDFIKQNFLRVPAGLWLTEFAWEPHLPKILSAAGIEYTLIDDSLFYQAGLSDDEVHGYYVTEDQGSTLKVFPVNNSLNEFIPFGTPEEGIDHLKKTARSRKGDVLVLAEDGETFGALPGTNKWMYEDKWLEEFLELLQQNKDVIRTTTFSEYISENAPLGKIYLPSASKKELQEISMPAKKLSKYSEVASEVKSFGKHDSYKEFLRGGGYFRNLLVKYPEADNLHKKMLYVSQKAESLGKGKTLGFSSGERDKKIQDVKADLLKGQCGSNYFHGTEGRIYSADMRGALYEHLLRAEVLADKLSRGDQKFIEVKSVDFDRDGSDEILASSNLLNCYFSPRLGGAIFELDHRLKYINLLNVCSRYQEPYHAEVSGAEPIHDAYRRMSLLDHFLPPDATFGQYRASSYKEIGDFVLGPYTASIRSTANEVNVKMTRKGMVRSSLGEAALEVVKTITLFSGQTQANIEYEITNMSEIDISALFGVEFNFSLDAGGHYLFSDGTKGGFDSISEGKNVREIKLIDEKRGISVSLETGDLNSLWGYPLEALAQGESGLERKFQGISLLLNCKLDIPRGSKWKNSIRLNID